MPLVPITTVSSISLPLHLLHSSANWNRFPSPPSSPLPAVLTTLLPFPVSSPSRCWRLTQFAVTDGGEVWSWGRGAYGQLGHGSGLIHKVAFKRGTSIK